MERIRRTIRKKRRASRLKALIGTSGYTYDHWGASVFYPEGLPKGKWFEFYATHFPTVELNVTFYRLPKKTAFRHWRKRAPAGFLFFVKGSRYVTHIKRLKDPKPSLKKFFGAVNPLKEKLAGTLWQLPPRFKKDLPRLENFLKAHKKYPGPCVMEFRDETWMDAETQALMEKYGAVYCRADWPDFYKCVKFPEKGAKIAYLRRHGVSGEKKYAARYSDRQIASDARTIRSLIKEGKTVFMYYNNDIGGQAIEDARRLRSALDGILGKK